MGGVVWEAVFIYFCQQLMPRRKKESFVYAPSLHWNNFQRAIMCPKSGHCLFYSAAFQSTTSTVWGNEFKEFYWNSFALSVDMDTNPQAPILYLLPTCNYSLFIMWDGSEARMNPDSFSWRCLTLRQRQQGRGWQQFPKTTNLSRV